MKMIGMLGLLVLLVFPGCSKQDAEATHKRLVWDANVETDMKEYRVYTCSVTPCLASSTPLATVNHVAGQTSFNFVVPHLDQYYVVYAVDVALNVSAPSATVFANVIPPNAPANVSIQ